LADPNIRIFILEGLLTVVLGLACPFVLPDSPATAKFLSDKERKFLSYRLMKDSGREHGQVNIDEGFKLKYVLEALKDWKVYLSVLILGANPIATYG
jgi:hypothetical protein